MGSISISFRVIIVSGLILFFTSLWWQASHVHHEHKKRAFPASNIHHSGATGSSDSAMQTSKHADEQAMAPRSPVLQASNSRLAPNTSILPPVTAATASNASLRELFEAGLLNFDPKGALEDVPSAVQAWRRAKLDWHSMVPKHNAKWQRFGDAPQGYKLRGLVDKETMVTDYLTRVHESGLSFFYGKDHGELLAEYAQCDNIADPCMIHAQASCNDDDFCTWHVPSSLCLSWDDPLLAPAAGDGGDKPATVPQPVVECENVHTIANGRMIKVTDISNQCQHYVREPVVLLGFDEESQSMFFHWWASFQVLYGRFFESVLRGSRAVHFLISVPIDTSLYQMLGALSRNCWRRVNKQVPAGTCFCKSHEYAPQQQHSELGQSAAKYLKGLLIGSEVEQSKLLVESLPPLATKKVVVCLISRRRKRFILNEYELCARAARLGYVCKLLPFELMTLFEQVKNLHVCDILVGVHGSGLDNSVFMRADQTVLVQIMPFRNEFRASFANSASLSRVFYQEWAVKRESDTFMHWDLFKEMDSATYAQLGKQEIIKRGQKGFDNRMTTMFWINQDTIIPLEEWERILSKASEVVLQSYGKFKEKKTRLFHQPEGASRYD